MPLVMVSRSNKLDDGLFQQGMRCLPTIIAENLNVPENPLAHFAPGDVEIRLQESPFDVRHRDVEVTIFATKFEARIHTGELRTEKMTQELRSILPNGMTGFVWLVLVDAFFSTF